MTKALYTIGHSNHPERTVLDLLRRHGIDVVVDVRSHPYCRYATQFNTDVLQQTLEDAGIRYLFLGKQLGGRPGGSEYYDDEGHVAYSRVAEAPFFLEGVERVQNGAETYRVCLMCSEEDPACCHRHLLVGRVLAGRGMSVLHIRGDGAVQSYDEIANQNARPETQRLLFDEEEPPWRSIRSVLPKPKPASSSES